MRMAISLEYDGSHYWGWQRQNTEASIQATVEQALSRVAAEPIRVFCAGRTDRGVHATTQIIHFDTSSVRAPHAWIIGGNSYLPKEIRLHWIQEVPADFHARFSAFSRRYCYVLQVSPISPAILAPYVSWRYGEDLNETAMAEACTSLLGQHNFSSFRAAECQAKTPIRSVSMCRLYKQKQFFVFEIEADGFLHHMVRNIMGVLIDIGLGKQSVGWMSEVLSACDRRAAAMTAPANGLYLTHIGYPQHFSLPLKLRKPVFLD
ncbi:MAG: tRNA pseudouridine(38-40) synthase TruA [Gammaproteobacteria bacterium]|nr:tRNA pseudouridine(38-40) synthase TruA [Gammaproteobacteria bacterium]